MGRPNIRAEQVTLASELRADGKTWVEIAEVLRGRYRVNARAALRLARGWSQKRAADEWCERWPDDPVTSKHLSWWECWPVSGHAPSLMTLGRLAELYECDLTDLVADVSRYRRLDDHAHDDTGEPVNRRGFLGGAGSVAALNMLPVHPETTRLAGSDVARLRARVEALRALDAEHGAGVAYNHALDLMRHIRRLIDEASYGVTVGRDLRTVAGEATSLAGWLAYDADRHQTARRLWTEALYIANVTENDGLSTYVMACMCQQAATRGDGREAVELAQATQRVARPFATPRLLSLLTTREARGHALRGDARACDAALWNAEQLLDEGEDDDEGSFAFAFWGPADFHCLAAEARTALGEPHEAERAQRAALESVNPGYPRNEALYLIRLADSLIAQSKVEEGATVASQALDRLPQLSSARLQRYVRALHPQIEAHASVPAAQAYLHQVSETLPLSETLP